VKVAFPHVPTSFVLVPKVRRHASLSCHLAVSGGFAGIFQIIRIPQIIQIIQIIRTIQIIQILQIIRSTRIFRPIAHENLERDFFQKVNAKFLSQAVGFLCRMRKQQKAQFGYP
jgi:hypothetical protein